MTQHYYSLPLDFKKLGTKGVILSTCNLKKSIEQNVNLIIISKYKEHRYDETYGCELWDLDFELVSSENMWLETIRKSVYTSLVRHEHRLYDLVVDIGISLDEKITTLQGTRTVKKRLTITVKGNVTETGDRYETDTNIYLSPLSLE